MSITPNAWIVTANFTEDGAVAWRREDGTWSRRVAEAGLLPDEPAAKALATTVAQREQREVSDPYVIEIAVTGGEPTPLTTREKIRAHGPTVRLRRPDARAAS